MPRLDRPRVLRFCTAAVELCLALIVAAVLEVTPLRADVLVEGPAAELAVDARQARIADILSALATHHNVHYRTSIELDEVINGSYSGSLTQVLARVLDGYSYVIKKNDAAIEVIVYGRRGERAIPASVPPPPPPPPNPATDWGQLRRP